MKTATVATGVQDWPGGRLAIKRGSGAEQLDVDEMEIASPAGDDDALLMLNDALEKFATADPRKAELVKLAIFCRHELQRRWTSPRPPPSSGGTVGMNLSHSYC